MRIDPSPESRATRRRPKPSRRGASSFRNSRTSIYIALAAVAVLMFASLMVILPQPPTNGDIDPSGASSVEAAAMTTSASLVDALADAELQGAVDELLAAVNPELPENDYFTDYAKEKLRWMTREHGGGRLTVAFLLDPASIRLPPDVLMAASQLDGQATIFIVKPRFASFLRERGRVAAPFDAQQKNDFALALIHEIVHLQNPKANPRDPDAFFREESRAWREVSLRVVRPFHSLNQPMHPRFLEADAALRICGDQLPCPSLAKLVRLTR